MPASQQHGFEFQGIIEREVFHLEEPPTSYTGAHDIPAAYNRFDPKENVSIKVTGSNSIGMGDPMRIFNYSPDEKHTALVIYYKQEPSVKKIVKIVEFSLDNKRALFGDVTRADIEGLIREIRSVPARAPNEELIVHRERINAMTRELSRMSGAIRFNAKIDSTTQRRLQCTITAIPDEIIEYSETSAYVRGVWITDHVASDVRTRNPR